MWKVGRLTSPSWVGCVRRYISLYSIRGWWGLLQDVSSYLDEKGCTSGSIYESFNYISQTELQLEGKVGVRRWTKRCTACVKSTVINLWLRIMVNKVVVHHGIIYTLIFLDAYSKFLSTSPHHKQNAIKGSNTGLCYSSSVMEGKDHLQLLGYRAVTFFFFFANSLTVS